MQKTPQKGDLQKIYCEKSGEVVMQEWTGSDWLCLHDDHEFYEITSVSREDLEAAGFDASSVADSTMRRLASKMADAYQEHSYWTDLDIIAEILEIPRKPKSA